jgi:hypothetical protein
MRYKGKNAEKLMQAFAGFMEMPLDFGSWIDLLENMLNFKSDLLKWVIFNIFDYNED